MKKQFYLLFIGMLLLNSFRVNAQFNWLVGGNATGGDRLFGSTTPFAVQFITNNVERGRVTNTGLWGFGTISPTAKLHINGTLGEDPFRVQSNGTTKLMVHSNGGISIGSLTAPSANNLFVNNNVGIGISNPGVKLHVAGGADASLSSGGFIVSGALTGENISIDNNEIMARNNGLASNLFLNHNGGDLIIHAGPSSAGGKVGIHTTAPAVEAHLVHGVGNGTTHGFRMANSGSNNENWTFYVQNGTGALELYANNVFRGSFNDVSGAYTSVSDIRLKKNIELAEAVLPKVLKLGVKKYHFLKNAPEDIKYYGLVAQEVEKIFPEVVYKQKGDDGTEVYTMDYNAFGVLAIKAIQEQQQKVSNLENQLAQQNERLAKLELALTSNHANQNLDFTDLDLKGISLEQNHPNPVDQTTTFRYTIPAGANAQIKIYDAATGMLVKSLIAPTNGQAQMNSSDLKTGNYIYTLIVNGKAAASKQMIISK
ncbi:tail fiber domain-containing protein [Adhaeribacter pallidiroseus]|uniref:Peptidase S74 domain-containing protein n=1 Tax=Adhaeribacter pallidiroseus TaxID=2072847 RepID=A0A369QNB2_9BACT|nr:tail fiber domain-containing protein [Adhaeribacter pallidiroseus]RDC65860.1 hypothetical protein AHMF7616_04491 [Adhaeribacter pallidiroseus]